MNTDGLPAPFKHLALGRLLVVIGVLIAVIAIAISLTVVDPVRRLIVNSFAMPVLAVAIVFCVSVNLLRLLRRRQLKNASPSVVTTGFVLLKVANLLAVVLIVPILIAAWMFGDGQWFGFLQAIILCCLFSFGLGFAQNIATNLVVLRQR